MLFRCLLFALSAGSACCLTPDIHGQTIDFVRDVQPILRKHCYECHGAEKQRSGLRLDIKAAAFKGGEGYGASIAAGDVAGSPLIELVSSDDENLRMPPKGRGLTAAEVKVLSIWVKQGAVWPDGVDTAKLIDRSDHWSFKPLQTFPASAYENPSRTVDRFITEKLTEHTLKMSPPVDKVSWLRRVSFNLIGLPPTPEQVAAFLKNPSPDARQQVVDELLASPRYGERWAQHWLDVVRYADTHGFEVNTPRPNAWPYRDYVIAAFNRDTPYNQFIKEQLAGDAFQQDAGTGFLVTAAVLLPGQIGKDDASKRLARQDSLAEMIINTSEAFLGLSVGCARCHDHKFDAITQHDYYAMQAFFSGVQYGDRPLTNSLSSDDEKQLADLKQRINDVENDIIEFRKQQQLPATNAKLNEHRFAARTARFVRLTIHDANRHPKLGLIEPCIDELEIYTTDSEPVNVALATHGTKVTTSGSRQSGSHQLAYIHDGNYGNSRSWMSDQAGRGWVEFKFPKAVEIQKVVWSRDRLGKYNDRLATVYSLEVGLERDSLKRVAGVTIPQSQQLQKWHSQKSKLEQQITALSRQQMVYAGRFTSPPPTHLLFRGDAEQPREVVAPAVPEALGDVKLDLDAPEQSRRLALAEWIARPQNPLTARVMVNRIWQGHFGTGLVATPSDFGRNGARPSHPKLLDWLAAEFIRNNWSVKHLHRVIVLSATYSQSSLINRDAQALDSRVRLLWRFPSRRLDAEVIRDSMLLVSGRLNLKVGGPGFDLFKSRGGLSGFPPIESFQADGLRRLIYAHKIRMEREAVFGAFDCPDAGQSTARRRQSTTPIQALNLLNSRFTIDEANAFAARIQADAGDDITQQIQYAFQRIYSRQPTPAELADVQPVIQQHGLSVFCRVLFNTNEFLFQP